MIDEEETYRRFGYHSWDLPPKSHKRVVAVCDKCGEVREVEKKQYRSLCAVCAHRTEEYRKKQSDITKGEKNPWYGKHLSKEHRQKISAAQKEEKSYWYGRHHSEETRRKMSESHKGKHLSDQIRRKIGNANRGRRKGKTYEEIYGIEKAQRIKKKIGDAVRGEKNPNYGRQFSDETKQKLREAAKLQWQNKEFIRRWIIATRTKPNMSEENMMRILSHLMPGEFAYNGDFSQGVSIGGRIPDFVDVNGHKWIIELFGELFHSPLCTAKRKIPPRRYYNETIRHYKKYGYKCIIFWTRDIDRPDAEAFVKRELKKAGWLK